MKFKSCGVVFIILLIGCSSKQSNNPKTVYKNDYLRYFMEEQTESVPSKTPYDGVIKQAAQRYAIDENLIRAIIKVESNFRVNSVSKSNAIGLMQVKASTAGRDAYRLQGKARGNLPRVNLKIRRSILMWEPPIFVLFKKII